ncbi:MAG: prepilin-type N-terminal cleavage/methylation domain-containing protein [candidate division Zixibacteria bacterium]|nr:prepilin-type N-terminal cleavage/methylation domain-containing protein [candidate division Zixibacteria bacterium]
MTIIRAVVCRQSPSRQGEDGFTLIELVMVIVLLGIVAAVAIPMMGSFLGSSKTVATKEEMRRLARAIAGNDDASDRGFQGDVGYPPSALVDLTRKPDSITAWNAFTHVGWKGPYIDSTNGDYLKDAWGTGYVYTPVARTLQSNGSGSPITITF